MLNKVAGRISLEGTRQGIADLLVVVYDLDPSVSSKLAKNNFSSGPSAPGAQGNSSGDDPVDSLVAAYPEARTWLEVPGDRIGSVLTDRSGRFELEYDDKAFRVRNAKEKRPDLVIFVLGPEHATRRTVASRLLHYNMILRVNAGRVEHYVIGLSPKNLAARGVTWLDGRRDPVRHLAREKENIDSAKQVKDHTSSLIRGLLAPGAALRTRVRNFRAALGPKLLKADAAASRFYVERGESVAAKHRDAIIAGVTRLRDFVLPHGIRMYLTPLDLGRAGIDTGGLSGGGAVEVSACDLLARKGLGAELTRVRGLLDARRAETLAENATTPAPAEEPEVTGPAPDISGEATAFITNRILGQLAELPDLKHAKGRSTIEELEKIKETINRLELSGGPANVTAFHDFHTLQIAFEDVWTAAFDDRLRDQVSELYRQSVALHEEYGLEVPPLDDIADANGLREYLATLRNETATLAILPVPADVQKVFPQMDLMTWNRLDEDGRSILRTATYNNLLPWSQGNDIDPPVTMWSSQEYLDGEYARVMKYHLNSPLAKAEKLILDVADRLNEPYAFKYYAPGTINYGILVTYRQEWVPESYQVGRLVSTVPLAPGEERKLKVTRKVNKSRAEKAIEKSLVESTSERQFTSRTELEVMSKVMSTTNFRMSATGSFNIGVGSISATSEFSNNQQQESSQNKKQFMEAVMKAAEHVRQETEVQVETNHAVEEGVESDTTLKNPNNELTVTYLLYELERRYRVTSRPHRLTPVVMVAMDIPAPHEITEGWVLEYAWIIKRCLLDDQFRDAIEHIEDGLSADSVDIEIKKANWDVQREALSTLESELERLMELRDRRQDSIVSLLESEQLAKAGEMDDGARAAAAIFSGGLSELFGGGTSDRDEIAKARREAAEKAMEFLKGRMDALSERVSIARKAFSDSAEAYSEAVKKKARKDSMIQQLKLHIRQNILHYMHSIWDYKHEDQQFFELNDMQVPFLESATRRCRMRRATADEVERGVPGVTREGDLYVVMCEAPVPPSPTEPLPLRRLGTVADLNRPLGYKGNYIIYPLKGCSFLTDFMSQDYVDDYFGLRDPSTDLGYTGEELLAYAADVLKDPASRLTDAERTALLRAVADDLTSPSSGTETVILPTGQLYMEALKGEQTLLEDFKLAHRGLDVIKVQEEIREERLENLRRGLRLVRATPVLDDPDVEKTVLVQNGTVVPALDVES